MKEVSVGMDLSTIEKVSVDNLLDVKSINVERSNAQNTVTLHMKDGGSLNIEYDKVGKKVMGLSGEGVHVAFNTAKTIATVIMPNKDE